GPAEPPPSSRPVQPEAVQPTPREGSGDPAEVYAALRRGLAENHPEAWYDALPIRYREELDAAIQAVARDADPELWDRALRAVRHWLPEALADGWSRRLRTFRESFGVGTFRKGLSADQKAQALRAFDQYDRDLDELLATDDLKVFDEKFTNRFVVPVLTALS